MKHAVIRAGWVFLLFLLVCFSAQAGEAKINPAYEAAAQRLIKTLIEKNELHADSWLWDDPKNWPEGTATWSHGRPKRLTSLNLEDWSIIGPVDVSGLTHLKELTLMFSQMNEATPGLLTIGSNPYLKSLTIYGDNGQFFGGPDQTVLTLDGLPSLERLFLHNYGVRTLNLRRNTKLHQLEISVNAELATLDLSANTALKTLMLYATRISSLDLSHNRALQSVRIEISEMNALKAKGNPFASIDHFIISESQMPLSALAALARTIPGKLFVGTQHGMFFDKKVFSSVEEAVLDLSSEAQVNGVPTYFVVLDDKLDIADPSRYRLQNGVITFTQRGRYVVGMCNRRINGDRDCDIFLKTRNFNRGHLPGFFSGHIEVGDVSDQQKITPSTC